MSLSRFFPALLLAVICSNAHAQPPSLSDLMPPVDGGSTKVAAPGSVSVEGDVVEAATAQDAVNAASLELDKDISEKRESGSSEQQDSFYDFKWVKFGSGYGIVSKGIAVFKEQPNPTAGLIAQRNAYVVAYTAAKMGMTRGLEGVTSEGTTENKEFSELIANDQDGKNTSGSVTTENIKQAANGLLKGYVVYSINEIPDPDDAKYRLVSVEIASTPKTLVASSRSGALQDVATLEDGLKATMTEIEKGLVPPVGGRVITVASTGKMAVVGFGSAIVGKSGNKALAMRSKIDAQRIADARASDSLVGILNGDKTVWTTGISSTVEQQFSESTKYAIDAEQDRVSDETVEASIETFKSNRSNQDIAVSIRKGSLPPGIIRKAWISEDGNWAKSICIYYPDSTAMAQDFSARMKAANLLSGVRDVSGGKRTQAGNAEESQGGKVDTSIPVFPGGQVNKDDL
jgi:hypothetical protein